MTKVFIGGSRRVSRLGEEIRQRIGGIIEKRLPVLIGDANGADEAVQRYLHGRRYRLVEVFCSDEAPRNNVGDWPLRVVRPSHATRDFQYYATKDRAMAREANVGFMIWDGASHGTLLNVLRLVVQHKTVVVYVIPRRTFAEARSRQDFDRLVSGLDGGAARRLHEQAVSEELAERDVEQPQLRL